MELNRSCSACRAALIPSLTMSWHLPLLCAQATQCLSLPTHWLQGHTSLGPTFSAPKQTWDQCAGNCISLLAALLWLSCAAITAAACRQTTPDRKLQSCPLCTHAPVPWKSCAHTETCMCVWQSGAWGHGLSNCAIPACA